MISNAENELKRREYVVVDSVFYLESFKLPKIIPSEMNKKIFSPTIAMI